MDIKISRGIRARWAAIGAAVAVSFGGGGLAITSALSSGERSVFVPIAPCRVFDTRPAPDAVGLRTSPVGPGETFTQQITGSNGYCTTPIPTDATAVSMNVTAVGGTANSYLTIWPQDVNPRPLTSSLNWVVGAPPTPNKVDVKLSPTGQIKIFNFNGSVNVLADVVGYYTDHDHDDRYYTKSETDGRYMTLRQGISFTALGAATIGEARSTAGWGCLSMGSASNSGRADVDISLPLGARLISATLSTEDRDPSSTMTATLGRTDIQQGFSINDTTVAFVTSPDGILSTHMDFANETTVINEFTTLHMTVTATPHSNGDLWFCGGSVTYVIDSPLTPA